ncbi:MAG: PEP-CTERM sorting domain-containing protein [Gemmatimonadaceae bacterium]|nr:PEP-CTERM sorting domain-containing protein [Gemmatimonadaceae bacterium]
MPLPLAPRPPRFIRSHRKSIAAALLSVLLTIPGAPLRAQVTLTQSASQVITDFHSVTCNLGGFTGDNSYFRTFTLSDFSLGAPFAISAVELGIEVAAAGAGQGGVVPVEINIYGNTTGTPGTFASLGSPLFSQMFSVVDQVLSLQSFLTPALVTTPGFTVEVRSPDLVSSGGVFIPGSNSAGETAPSYIAAPACALSQPVTFASIGYPQTQLVMNVTGTTVPEPSTYALMAAGLAGTMIVARRRRARVA